jgi:hypothetical protein
VLVALLPGAPKRVEDAPLEPGAPQVYHAPKPIRMTPRVRREVDETVEEFVRSAVLRRDLERSWRLASPEFRAATTRADWIRGDLPVFPYPADPARTTWDVDYADASELALNVTLLPRHGVRTDPEVFGVSLEPAGRGKRRHWLVGAWYARGSLSHPEPPVASASRRRTEPTAAEKAAIRRATEGQIDPVWWLIPAGALALIVLGPLAAFAVVRLRAQVARRRAT